MLKSYGRVCKCDCSMIEVSLSGEIFSEFQLETVQRVIQLDTESKWRRGQDAAARVSNRVD